MHLILLLPYLEGLCDVGIGIGIAVGIGGKLRAGDVSLLLVGEFEDEVVEQPGIGQRVVGLSGYEEGEHGLTDIVGQCLLDVDGTQGGIVDAQSLYLQAVGKEGADGVAHGIGGAGGLLHESHELSFVIEQRQPHAVVGHLHAEGVVGIVAAEGLGLAHTALDSLLGLKVGQQPGGAAFACLAGSDGERLCLLCVDKEFSHVVGLAGTEDERHRHLLAGSVDDDGATGSAEGLVVADGLALLADEHAVAAGKERA